MLSRWTKKFPGVGYLNSSDTIVNPIQNDIRFTYQAWFSCMFIWPCCFLFCWPTLLAVTFSQIRNNTHKGANFGKRGLTNFGEKGVMNQNLICLANLSTNHNGITNGVLYNEIATLFHFLSTRISLDRLFQVLALYKDPGPRRQSAQSWA